MADPKHDERRSSGRVPFDKEVEVVGVGVHRSSDISIGGMYLITKQGFPTGNSITLRFKLRDSDARPIQARARVLYTHKGVGVGLGFIDLNSEDLASIVKFTEQA
ncbi:MAG TPA: PilZ domain-containing protein [Nitrospiria bacterium]|jgi:c-di-GMP-binding flagellar brake protein YcgR|nr:PilZ domain-containing protein [Nitrospiria bacterium]